ncbi:MAG: SGNH/GDSL hydrolase family protein [Alphaproteobacteria bacterium]|nr:SGNH/GDSL hydrolase family protein [Alphaproteobacteria bacterium]
MTSRSSARTWTARGLALLLGLGLAGGALAALEQQLRAAEARSGLVWLPDEPGRKFGLAEGKSTNAAGFRGPARPLEKPAGVTRIVVLGDSVTFGNGVRADELWTVAAEQALRARGERVELINLAVYSYDIGQIAATLEHRGWAYDPDLVVYAAYTNDHLSTDHVLIEGQPVFVGERVPEGLLPFGEGAALSLARRSALGRRLLGGLSARRGLREAGDLWSGGQAFFAEQLSEMATASRSREVPLLVYALGPHPLAGTPAGCEAPAELPLLCEDALRLLAAYDEAFAAAGLPHASAVPYLRGSGRRAFYLSENTIDQDPHHPTPEGHRVLAAGFIDTLDRWRGGRPLATLDETLTVEAAPAVTATERKPPLQKKGKGPPKRPRP